MKRIFLIPLLALGLLATSCDGGANDASAATIAVNTAAREASGDSARFSMRITADTEDGEVTAIFGEGMIDFADGEGEMTVPQREGEAPVRHIWHGGSTYASWLDTGFWMQAEDEGSPLNALKVSGVLDMLARAANVAVVGTEEVGGLQATHYRFTAGPEFAPEDLRDAMRGVSVTVDVWLSEDRVHRIVSDQAYGDDPHEGVRGQRFLVEIDLFDWGVDVAVTPPDPSLIRTFDELSSLP